MTATTHIPTAAEIAESFGEPGDAVRGGSETAAKAARAAYSKHATAARSVIFAPGATGTPEQTRAARAHVSAAEELRLLADQYDTIPDTATRAHRQAPAVSERGSDTGNQFSYDRVGRVGAEARTYNRPGEARGVENGGTSFFRDAVFAEMGDYSARDRLARHQREAEVENEISKRATTTGSFAGLVIPQYLVGLSALASRNGRPVSNSISRLPLPDEGMSLLIPRGTTGVSVAAQATENSAVSSTDEVWANLSVPVVTAAGQQDVSRQSIERGAPGLDQLIYADLASAYAAEIDRQVITGTGASGQALGFLNTAGIFQSTAFAAAATATTAYSKIAGCVNSIESAGTTTGPADLIVMNPRRWSWLLLQVDTAGRPLITPTAGDTVNMNGLGANTAPGYYSGNMDAPNDFTGADFTSRVVRGYFQGLPVVTSASVPINLGDGALEDVVGVLSTRHHLLFENGDGMPTQLKFEATLANSLTVKLVSYGYFAYTASRYPLATALAGGNAGTSGFGLTSVVF